MASRSHVVLFSLTLTLTLTSITSAAAKEVKEPIPSLSTSPEPSPEAKNSPELSPEDKKSLEKVSKSLGLTPEQKHRAGEAISKLESGSPLSPEDQEKITSELSPEEIEKVVESLSPEQQRRAEDAALRVGSGEAALSPGDQGKVKGELSPAEAKQLESALSPEVQRDGKKMAEDMVRNSGMSPAEQKVALGDAEKAIEWGNVELKGVLEAEAKEDDPKESEESGGKTP